MGTIILSSIFNRSFIFNNCKFSIFGNLISNFINVLSFFACFVLFFPFALVENIIIFPFWFFYNLFHKKEFRLSYVKFLDNLSLLLFN